MNGIRPAVTVIIPFFNHINWTLEAVHSVLNQSLPASEVLLVDDGSTEPVDRLQLLEDSRVRIIQQANRGPAAARNNGMRNARGEFIAFLDSDDLYTPGKLACQVEIHLRNPELLLSHTSYQTFQDTGERLEVIHSGRFSGNVWPRILYGCPIATSTVMLSRALLERGDWYEEEYRVAEDIIFYSKVAAHSVIAGLDEPLSLVRLTQYTHAYDPRKQIIGTQNIVHYVASGKAGLSPSERRKVTGENYFYIAENLWSLKKPLAHAWYVLRSFLVSPGRDGAVVRRIDPSSGRPAYRLLRSIYHSAKKDSHPDRGYFRWAVVRRIEAAIGPSACRFLRSVYHSAKKDSHPDRGYSRYVVRSLLSKIPLARPAYHFLRSTYQAIAKWAHRRSP